MQQNYIVYNVNFAHFSHQNWKSYKKDKKFMFSKLPS